MRHSTASAGGCCVSLTQQPGGSDATPLRPPSRHVVTPVGSAPSDITFSEAGGDSEVHPAFAARIAGNVISGGDFEGYHTACQQGFASAVEGVHPRLAEKYCKCLPPSWSRPGGSHRPDAGALSKSLGGRPRHHRRAGVGRRIMHVGGRSAHGSLPTHFGKGPPAPSVCPWPGPRGRSQWSSLTCRRPHKCSATNSFGAFLWDWRI